MSWLTKLLRRCVVSVPPTLENQGKEPVTIRWDRPMRERLRKAYSAAVAESKDQFTFEGNEYVTRYAMYLLEHLDNVLGK